MSGITEGLFCEWFKRLGKVNGEVYRRLGGVLWRVQCIITGLFQYKNLQVLVCKLYCHIRDPVTNLMRSSFYSSLYAIIFPLCSLILKVNHLAKTILALSLLIAFIFQSIFWSQWWNILKLHMEERKYWSFRCCCGHKIIWRLCWHRYFWKGYLRRRRMGNLAGSCLNFLFLLYPYYCDAYRVSQR